ncbi:hypothetical protein [Methylobacterium mesophilicum]
MASPLFVDLRACLVAAVEDGASRHLAAKRFGASLASAVRSYENFARDGWSGPKPMGGDQLSHTIVARADLIVSTYDAEPEIFLSEPQERAAGGGHSFFVSPLQSVGIERMCRRDHRLESLPMQLGLRANLEVIDAEFLPRLLISLLADPARVDRSGESLEGCIRRGFER